MRQTAIACLLAAACLPAAAQSLKPGLWEMHNKMGGNAQMDQAMAEMRKQLATMPADQRKQMEAMMAAQGVQVGSGGAGGMSIAQSRKAGPLGRALADVVKGTLNA